jgi:hypothetical protein
VERVPDGRAEGGEVDRQLVESPQRGDKAAFVDLVRSRVDRLFALAHRILRELLALHGHRDGGANSDALLDVPVDGNVRIALGAQSRSV